MSDVEITAAITMYELELGIPATDALTRPVERLVDMVVSAFPELERMRLTSLMWDQVVEQAFARYHGPPPDAR